jgi:PTS system fructose-specific IIC component
VSVFSADLVDLNLVANDKNDAIRQMAQLVVSSGRGNNTDQIVSDVLARDALGTPQVDGVAIPHARSKGVTQSSVVVARTNGILFDPEENPADVLFMILVPDANSPGADSNEHIEILSGLARRLMNPEFTSALRSTTDKTDLANLLANGEG